MKKRLSIASVFLCAVSTMYTVWYMHFGTPYKNSGALSKIGLAHHGLFIIWGALTFCSLSFGIVLAYRRYTRTKLYIPLLAVSGIGMALTLGFDFDYAKRTEYFLHCAGSLTFSVVMGVTIFILFAMCIKKDVMFGVYTFITGSILVGDLILLLIYKENALIESLPIFAGYILLGITNLRSEKVETLR